MAFWSWIHWAFFFFWQALGKRQEWFLLYCLLLPESRTSMDDIVQLTKGTLKGSTEGTVWSVLFFAGKSKRKRNLKPCFLWESILEHEDVQDSQFIHLVKAEEVCLEGGGQGYVTGQLLAKVTGCKTQGSHLAEMLPTWAEGAEGMK